MNAEIILMGMQQVMQHKSDWKTSPISNQQNCRTRNFALHKENKLMAFTYKQYKDNFGIIRLESAATEDSQIKVLPLKPEGNLSS